MSRTHRKHPPNLDPDEAIEFERDHMSSEIHTNDGDFHTEEGKKFAKKLKHHKDRLIGKEEIRDQEKDL